MACLGKQVSARRKAVLAVKECVCTKTETHFPFERIGIACLILRKRWGEQNKKALQCTNQTSVRKRPSSEQIEEFSS